MYGAFKKETICKKGQIASGIVLTAGGAAVFLSEIIWSETFNIKAAAAIFHNWTMRAFLYNVWKYGMIYICVIIYLAAYCLYRSGNKKQKAVVPDMRSEKWKIDYYKNLMDHKVITQKEYQSMIEKIKLGQLM